MDNIFQKGYKEKIIFSYFFDQSYIDTKLLITLNRLEIL